jgi:glycerol-3-phosphate acyltransferase PlsY
MLDLIAIVIISYLLGSIPTAIIFGKLLRGIDIREHGSKNAGATNVFRVMGAKVALTVLAIDALKGWAAVVLVSQVSCCVAAPILAPVYLQILAGLAAIVGHVWTVFAQFKGGKGVGTALGVFIGLLPIPALSALAAWIIVVAITRYVSVASLTAAVVLPVTAIIQKAVQGGGAGVVIFAGLIGALIWFTHIPNIKRLLAGTENKFGKKTGELKATS